TAMPRPRAGRWRPWFTTSSASSTRAWPSSTPSAIGSPSSCSGPPVPWTRPDAGPGSTGFTPRSCRGRRCGTTSSWTTSPRAAPLCRLAERLAAPLVDLAVEYQGRPSVPGRHPLDMSGARDEVVREADLILALDVTNLLGAMGQVDRSTREVRLLNESTRVISISLDDYAVRSWAQTFQSLIPVDLPIAADAALALPMLVAAVED